MKLVSLQGKVYVANRDANGNPLAFRYLENVPSIEITLESNTVEHFESTSGQRLQDGRLSIGKTAGIALTLDEWTQKNIALALYGTDAVIAGSTVTAEKFPAMLKVGDYVRLKQQDVSSLVIKDSAGAPATLVAGTDYELVSAKHGTVKILDVGAYTQPFKADYQYAGGVNVALFSAAPPELWLKVDGVNTAEGNKAVLAELYRVIFDPASTIQLIHNEGYGPLELAGSVLYDATKVSDATLGQFGRMVEMA